MSPKPFHMVTFVWGGPLYTNSGQWPLLSNIVPYQYWFVINHLSAGRPPSAVTNPTINHHYWFWPWPLRIQFNPRSSIIGKVNCWCAFFDIDIIMVRYHWKIQSTATCWPFELNSVTNHKIGTTKHCNCSCFPVLLFCGLTLCGCVFFFAGVFVACFFCAGAFSAGVSLRCVFFVLAFLFRVVCMISSIFHHFPSSTSSHHWHCHCHYRHYHEMFY